jgi:predicted kinase
LKIELGIICGFPGAGKSTFIEKRLKNHIVLRPIEIMENMQKSFVILDVGEGFMLDIVTKYER